MLREFRGYLKFCGTFAFRGDEEAWGGVSGIWDSSIQARVCAGFSGSCASLQEFTSAAIRRDSQYAFYGHANTVLCKGRGCNSEEEGVRQYAECVGWAIGSTHHLNGCLGAARVAYTKIPRRFFLNFNFQIKFLKTEEGYDVKSIHPNISHHRKHSAHAIPIWIPIFRSCLVWRKERE